MVAKEFAITNKMGLHMRPANLFVQTMSKHPASTVTIRFGDKVIDGKSIMNLMASCIKCGSTITVECNGPDEAVMLQEAAELIESGFGEE